MAKPRDLVVRWVSDVSGFLRGTDQVERALDDQVRDLQHVEQVGEQSARELAQAYERAGQRIRQSNDKTAKDSATTYGEAGKEAGAEFASNLGESISSGDVSGMLSGTVGGLVGTFGAGGPIALALGALGAVSIGVFQSMSAAAEKARAAAALAFDELKSGADRQARLGALLEDQFGSQLDGWEAIARLSEATGESSKTIADALIDGGSKARAYADEWDKIARSYYEATGNLDRQTSILSDGADLLNRRADALDRAARAAQTERDALRVSETILKRSAEYYAKRGSAYAPGGSTYSQQVPPYSTGKR